MSTEADPAAAGEIAAGLQTFAARALVYNLLASEALGLAPADLVCMCLLQLHGPATPGWLAERTGLSTGAVTGVVDRLERAGYDPGTGPAGPASGHRRTGPGALRPRPPAERPYPIACRAGVPPRVPGRAAARGPAVRRRPRRWIRADGLARRQAADHRVEEGAVGRRRVLRQH